MPKPFLVQSGEAAATQRLQARLEALEARVKALEAIVKKIPVSVTVGWGSGTYGDHPDLVGLRVGR